MNVPKLDILYVGAAGGTSLQRAHALCDLGHHVLHVPCGPPDGYPLFQLYRVLNHLKHPPDLLGANRAVKTATRDRRYHMLWVDKGLSLSPRTIKRLQKRCPKMVRVAYSPDDMNNPSNQSAQYLANIPLFHLHVTTKSYNVVELKEMGARDVLFIDNAYDPETHRPMELTPEEVSRYKADLGFVGGFEEARARQIYNLAKAGLKVSVWGDGWTGWYRSNENFCVHDHWLNGIEYSKAICATKINLGFLRKINRDLQTQRSIEIPAIGAFMLAERTDEHRRLFLEGKEAEFFSSYDELLEKSLYYLQHEEQRRRVAKAGLRRCREGGYSNQERLARVLDYALQRAEL